MTQTQQTGFDMEAYMALKDTDPQAFADQFFRRVPKVPIYNNFPLYKFFIRSSLFPSPVFKTNQFLSNLVEWVIHERCPIFYWPRTEEERLAYFGCYGIIPAVSVDGPLAGRDNRYRDKTIVSLTTAHEFAHNMFSYPYSLKDHTRSEFDKIMQRNEHSASNFTEVVVYYEERELLKLTEGAFFRPSWIDVLMERYPDKMPNLAQLQTWRRTWIEDPETWENQFLPPDARYDATRAYMDRFFKGNEDFNHQRLERLLKIKDFQGATLPSLIETSYMDEIRNYVPPPQDVAIRNYEARQLQHITLLYKLLDVPNPPATFEEAYVRLSENNEFKDVNFVLD